MSRRAKKISVVIQIPNARGDAFHAVVRELKHAGLEAAEPLDKLGLVTGSYDPDQLGKLRAITGVGEVRPEGQIGIASVSQ